MKKFCLEINGEHIDFNMKGDVNIEDMDADKQHITKLLDEGYTSGEVCHQPPDSEGTIYDWWHIK